MVVRFERINIENLKICVVGKIICSDFGSTALVRGKRILLGGCKRSVKSSEVNQWLSCEGAGFSKVPQMRFFNTQNTFTLKQIKVK